MADLILFYAATPETAYVVTRDRTLPDLDATGESGGEVVELVARRGGCPGGTAVEITVPEQDARPVGLGRFHLKRDAVTPDMIGRAYQPWHADVEPDSRQRWKGYLQPDSLTLRNLIGAQTPGALEARESAWVEWRLLELAEQPTAAATFDLAQLREIHRRLFQDVYPWAGETRTVQMSRPGQGPGFFDWQGIEEGFEQIQDRLAQSNYLRGASRSDFVTEATEIYNAVNTMHAFREGNGRTQREWVTDLARGAGYDLNWTRVHGFTNDVASRRAREGDLTALRQVIETVATPRTETRSDASERGSKPSLRQVPPAQARDVQGPQPEEPRGPTRRY